MVDEEGKKEEKFEFTPEGEALGYISLDQARVLAVEHARDNTDFYGRRYAGRALVWEVISAEESEDYYDIRLSYRPAGRFRGEPGVEQFTIDKTGPVRLRQILDEPVEPRRLRLPLILAGLVVIVGAVVGGLFVSGVLPPPEATPTPLAAATIVPTAAPITPTAPATPSTPTPPPTPPPVTTPSSVEVRPEKAATLSSPNRDVTVILPVGSVTAAVRLWYQKVSIQNIPPAPPGFAHTDKVFDLSVTGEQLPTTGRFSFAKPVIVTIPISGEDALKAGGDKSNVVIQHFDTDRNQWLSLPTTVDFSASTAQALVDSLSIFALTIRRLPTPTATPGPPALGPGGGPTHTPTSTPTPPPTATRVTRRPLGIPPTPTPTPTATHTPVPVAEAIAVASVEVTPASAAVREGQSIQLKATPRDARGNTIKDRPVTWSSSNPRVAAVSPTGVVKGVLPGFATIKATSEDARGTADITVAAIVASLEVIPPAATIEEGQTLGLKAEPRDARGNALTGRPVTWSSSNPRVATVSSTGLVKAVLPGSAVITGASEDARGTADITVTVVVQSVDVSPPAATIGEGQSIQLKATPRDARGHALARRAVIWSSTNPRVATVSSTGLIKAGFPGSVVVTATAEKASGAANITVVAIVASVEVSPPSATTREGDGLQLIATPRDARGNALARRAVIWSSSNPRVAAVSSTGLMKAGLPGSAVITATAEGKSGAATITVGAIVAFVEVSPPNAGIPEGLTLQLEATPKDARGDALAGRAVTWSSSNPRVAAVSSTGLVKAGLPGFAVITATSEGERGEATITVEAIIAFVEVSPPAATIEEGQSIQLKATPRGALGNALTGRAVAWSSSNPRVATVSSAGLVKGVFRGSAAITATSEGRTGFAEIFVAAKALPNLVPFQPQDWDAPLVVSEKRSSFIDFPPPMSEELLVGEEAYLHWAVGNETLAHVEEAFQVLVLLDGVVIETFSGVNFGTQQVETRLNIPITIDTPGGHILTLVVDPDNRIQETNEADNEFGVKLLWREPGYALTINGTRVTGTSVAIPNATVFVSLAPNAANGLYAEGTQVSIEIDPAAGYAGECETMSVIMTAHIDVTCKTVATYALLINGNQVTRSRVLTQSRVFIPNGTVVVIPAPNAPDARYIRGTVVTLTLTPATGYDGSCDTTSVTMTSNFGVKCTTLPSGHIAFHSNRDGNYEIYVMHADGSEVSRLTFDAAGDFSPVWSPGGKQIAFRSDRDGNGEIYVMDADGFNQRRLTKNSALDFYPSWSPDGQKIAFTSQRDANSEIYVMSADGSDQVRLTNSLAVDEYPSWSPDGSKIAFHSFRDGNWETYVMNANGSSQVRLTFNTVDDIFPTWSPDGSKIAFVSTRDGNAEIYSMNPDGSNQTRISKDSARDTVPAWSPDGSKIAFASNRDGDFEIYVMNADGSNQTRITHNPAGDLTPDWGP